MKFVVSGMFGVISASVSRSALKNSLSASELNRLKSRSLPGFMKLPSPIYRGGMIWVKSVMRCDQNAVPHASLTASMVW